MTVIISILILVLMLIAKYTFLGIEPGYFYTAVGMTEIAFFTAIFILGVINIFKNKLINHPKLVRGRYSVFIPLFLIGVTLMSVVFSFHINLSKQSIHWDAVALYDARAKFLADGMKFSEMPNLSRYDNLNKYYYLLYPPYTSIYHYIWKSVAALNTIPVSAYYSFIFAIFVLIIFFVVKEFFGVLIALLTIFLTATNSSIFNVVVKEYTNLPFDLYIVGGVLLLFSHLRKPESWKYLFAILMVASSMWVRLLEPIWFAVFIAFAITSLERKHYKKYFKIITPLLLVCLLEYFSWTYFTKAIASNPGFVNFTKINILDTFLGILTGAPIVVFYTIAKSWGIPFIIHILAIVSLILNYKNAIKNKGIIFLGLFIFSTILIYFSEFYVLSFQAEWWWIVTMSLDRSSTFLIPISALILIDVASNYISKGRTKT